VGVAGVVAGPSPFPSHGWREVQLRQEWKCKEEKVVVVQEDQSQEGGGEAEKLVGEAVVGAVLQEPRLQLSAEEDWVGDGELATLAGEREGEVPVPVQETEQAHLEEGEGG
jgi:hypothetical protein